MNVFFSIIGIFLLWSGTILIYDARPITKSLFSFGDQNEATTGFKLFGFMFCIAGGLLLYFNLFNIL